MFGFRVVTQRRVGKRVPRRSSHEDVVDLVLGEAVQRPVTGEGGIGLGHRLLEVGGGFQVDAHGSIIAHPGRIAPTGRIAAHWGMTPPLGPVIQD